MKVRLPKGTWETATDANRCFRRLRVSDRGIVSLTYCTPWEDRPDMDDFQVAQLANEQVAKLLRRKVGEPLYRELQNYAQAEWNVPKNR